MKEDEIDKLSEFQMCKKCNIKIRQDSYHCNICNTCSEFHDHHCPILQICICSKNYKYFIQFFSFACLMLISFLGSLIQLLVSIKNQEIVKEYKMQIIILIFLMFILVFFFLAMIIMFIMSSRYTEATVNDPITK